MFSWAWERILWCILYCWIRNTSGRLESVLVELNPNQTMEGPQDQTTRIYLWVSHSSTFRSMMDYLNPKIMPSPSSFIPQIEYAKVCSQLVPLLSIFRGCQGENPYTHLKEIEEICSTLISRLECLHEPNENEAFFSSNFERQSKNLV